MATILEISTIIGEAAYLGETNAELYLWDEMNPSEGEFPKLGVERVEDGRCGAAIACAAIPYSPG